MPVSSLISLSAICQSHSADFDFFNTKGFTTFLFSLFFLSSPFLSTSRLNFTFVSVTLEYLFILNLKLLLWQIVFLPSGSAMMKLTDWPSSDLRTSSITPLLFQRPLLISWMRTESPSLNSSALLLPCFFAILSCFSDLMRMRSSCLSSFDMILVRLDLTCRLKNLSEGEPDLSAAWCWFIANTAACRPLSENPGILDMTSLMLLTPRSAGALL